MSKEEFLVLLDLDIVNIWICQRTNIILFVLTLFFNAGFRFLHLSLVFVARMCPFVDLLSCLNDPGVSCCLSPLVKTFSGHAG